MNHKSLEPMLTELYKYLTLNCSFPALYSIDGFKASYYDKDFISFVDTLIENEERHKQSGYFDREDSFLNVEYKEGVKKKEINQYFLEEAMTRKPDIEQHFKEKEDARLHELSEKTKVDYEALKKLNEMGLLRI